LTEIYIIDGYEINQYTGLKDKNGKEVYEGDIAEIKMIEGVDENEENLFIGTVQYIWLNYGFSLKRLRCENKDIQSLDSASFWHCFESEYVEIIGNIYENPELLKEYIREQ
jgi:uncharacterized phage protein (TIGR01671 family)